MIRIICHVLLIFTVSQLSNVKGRVHAEYQVTTYPRDVLAEKEGNDVVLDCRDEGPFRAPIVWTSPNGMFLRSGSDGRVVLYNVKPEQAGRYECAVPRRKRKGSVVGNASQFLVLVVEPFSSGQCEEAHARCRSGECLAHKLFCDRRANCADRSDEFQCLRAKKRSGSPRPAIGHYPGDYILDRCQPLNSWSHCDKRCKQYLDVSCSDSWQPNNQITYRRSCQRPQGPCGDIKEVVYSWSSWTEWSDCSATCGEAVRQRTRSCSHKNMHKCSGLPAEVEPCPNVPCPIDGGWSAWGEWTLCTELGYRSRERLCDSPPPLHGGRDCVGVYLETQECHVCSSTVHLKLTPGRVRCTVGRPTTFVCEYCSDDPDSKFTIDMDTEPLTSKETPVHDNMHAQAWSGPCLRRAWSLKLNNDHHRVSCTLKDSEDEVVGKVISTVKIQHEGMKQTYADCLKGQFTCKDKRCIDDIHFCDGQKDCGDGSDEANCQHIVEPEDHYPVRTETCGSYERYCPTSNLCIPETLVGEEWGADWITSCGKIATGKSNCRRGQFCCASHQCLTSNCQCDGVNDCGDWSDEIGCQYVGAPHRSPTQILVDMPFFSNGSPCFPEQIRCRASKKCILRTQVCDGTEDCDDGSDEEESCNGGSRSGMTDSRLTTRVAEETRPAAPVCGSLQFLCDKNRCLDWDMFWCDGAKDCADGSDEASCPEKAVGVNCTEMEFTCSNQQCIPLHVYCDDDADCVDGTDEEKNCVKPKIRRECEEDEFKCSSVAACVGKERKCDGNRDCPDASDEDNCPADDVKTNEIPDEAMY